MIAIIDSFDSLFSILALADREYAVGGIPSLVHFSYLSVVIFRVWLCILMDIVLPVMDFT